LRQILRKNSSIFHRLPHGAYGLLSWYPNAKPAKADDDEDSDGAEPVVRKTKSAKPKRAKAASAASPATGITANENVPLGPFIMEIMKDGRSWDVARLKQELGPKGLKIPPDILGRKVQGTLLSLASQKMIVNAGNRQWRKTDDVKAAAAHDAVAASKTAH
jgi:hypothetical protein